MKTALDYSTPDANVFWTAGLDGRGQIVGMGDSGIDMQSCFFSDPQNPFVLPVGSKEWVNPQHRKVVYYHGLADEYFRDLVGHGTHTAGSVAGFNPNAPDSKATGAAKGARLAFTDLSRTAGGDVNAPPNLERDYFPRMYANGARIFSGGYRQRGRPQAATQTDKYQQLWGGVSVTRKHTLIHDPCMHATMYFSRLHSCVCAVLLYCPAGGPKPLPVCALHHRPLHESATSVQRWRLAHSMLRLTL